jgi:hypothetical protein
MAEANMGPTTTSTNTRQRRPMDLEGQIIDSPRSGFNGDFEDAQKPDAQTTDADVGSAAGALCSFILTLPALMGA